MFDPKILKSENFGPVHAPLQIQVTLSEKQDYTKGMRCLVEDVTDDEGDGREHEQAFDKGERVRCKEGRTWWVFYTKRGRVRVISDDEEGEQKWIYKKHLTEVDN